MNFPHIWLLRETTEEYKATKWAKGQCITYRCRRKKEKWKTRCCTCRSRLHRLRNPLRYAFDNLRASAAKRRIEFTLTFEEFTAFCERTDYHNKRGKGDTDLSVDRRDTTKGYTADNIRVLTWIDNASHKHEDGSAPADF